VELPSWSDRRAALRYVGPLVRLVWQTHRGLTFAMGALRLSRALLPLATLWIAKLIIDAVVAFRESGPDYWYLGTLVGAEIAVVVVADALARASALVESLLGDLFSNRTSVMLMEHAATLDLAQFENPAFYDQLERARRQTTGRIGLLTMLFSMAQDTITLVSLAAALFVYSPLLLLLLAVAVVPSFLGETHFASLEYSLLFRRTPERRQLDYLRYAGASDQTAKEVQLFGLAPWLIARYRQLADAFYRENRALSRTRALVGGGLAALGTAAYYGAYVLILASAVSGGITLGTLTFLTGAFQRARGQLQSILGSANGLAASAIGSWIADIQKSTASARSVAEMRLVKMKDDA
jgi:ATP-binding cassette subfamily B protein